MAYDFNRFNWRYWGAICLWKTGPKDIANITLNLWERKRGKTHLRSRPFNLAVEVTSYCNLKCRMCPHASRNPEHMSFERFRRLLDDPFLSRWFVLTFVGLGEPLLHPDFFAMASHAQAKGKTTVLFTNGTLLNPERVEQIIESGISRVIVSIDSPDPQTYKEIRGANLDRVVHGVNLLVAAIDRQKAGVDVVITTVCLLENMRQLPEIVDLASQCGVKTVHFQHLETLYNPYGYAPSWSEANVIPPDLETSWESISQTILRRAAGAGIFVKLQPFPERPKRRECLQPWHSLSIRANGDVARCCVDHFDSFGNAFIAPLGDLWNSKAMRQLRASLSSPSPIPMCWGCTNY